MILSDPYQKNNEQKQPTLFIIYVLSVSGGNVKIFRLYYSSSASAISKLELCVLFIYDTES